MKPDFWLKKWESNEIGFHQSHYNQLLVKYWSSLGLQGEGEVFVPFCGKSKDMLWLRQEGHEVLGNEISERAVDTFFQENDFSVERVLSDHFCIYKSDHLQILAGDYFALTKSHIHQVKAVFDRASLVALPREWRRKYVNHLRQCLPSQCVILLITLEYEKDLLRPPPFDIYAEEIDELYGPWCEVTHLETHPALIKDQLGYKAAYRLHVV